MRAILLLFPCLVQLATAALLADFTKCIGPQGQGPTCQLDAGTYQISTALLIGRPNITIQGATANATDTVLQRADGSKDAIMRSAYTGFGTQFGVTSSVTIRRLTFDGRRGPDPSTWISFRPDLAFYWANSILITNCRFINAPFLGIGMQRDSKATGYDLSGIVVNKSYFANVAVSHVGANAVNNCPNANPLQCDENYPDWYKLCDGFNLPHDLVIVNSEFHDAGEGAVTIEAKNSQIRNNLFQHNFIASIPQSDSGGQLLTDICSDNVAVTGNTILDGPLTSNGLWAWGFETHGIDTSIVDNLITNNWGHGIMMHGTKGNFIANWDVRTATSANNIGGMFDGIAIVNAPGARPTDSVEIDHANAISGHNWGIRFYNNTAVPIDHVTITNNCLSGNLKGTINLNGMGADVFIANNQSTGCGPR